jgi:hypothetical protein
MPDAQSNEAQAPELTLVDALASGSPKHLFAALLAATDGCWPASWATLWN